MKIIGCLLFIAVLFAAAAALPASEEDSVAAVYAYGRTGTKLTTGFAIGDGSYLVTSIDSVREVVNGNPKPVPYAVVVSRWTGDAYVARVAETDESSKLALLKLPVPAFPAIPIAADNALGSVRTTSLGDVVSGDDAGARFSSEILALKATKKPDKYVVGSWRGSKACMAEVRDRWWLFLSDVKPLEKIPDAAVVIKRGVGAIGLYYRRIIISDGQKSVTYYRATPAQELRAFLTNAGIPKATLSQPPSAVKQSSDAEQSFQAMCLAISASTAGSPASASNRASAAARLRPKSALAQILVGMALSRQGKHEDALKAIDTALQLDPKVPDGNLNRGIVLSAAGKPDEAEKSYRKAMADDPNDARPLLAISDLLTSGDRRLDEAVSLAKDAVRLAPQNPTAHLTLARALKHSKDYDGAIAELQSVLKTAPKWPDAHLALGATYEAAGKMDMAEAQYRTIVELQPLSPPARLTLIDFLISAGKKSEARKEIDAARKLKLPNSAEEALKKLEGNVESDKSK